MTKHLQLSSMLDHIQAEVPDVRAAVLASRDGLAMASTIDGAESSRIAAMAATVHGVGDRVSETAELGDLVETVIRSEDLTFIVYDAGTPAVLALLAAGDCNLGLVHLEGRRTAAALAEMLTVSSPPEPSAADDAAETDDDTDTDTVAPAGESAESTPSADVIDDEYTSRFAPPPPPPTSSHGPDETSPNGYDDSGEHQGDHEHATS